MTREMVIALIESLGEDASYWTDSEGKIHMTIEDFEGFDSHWSEIMRDYDEDAVEAALAQLAASAIKWCEDFYSCYYFDGFCVEVGYSSYDI